MTTSATTAPALMAFPRYPELPPELRLTVIENTLDSLPEIDKWACDKGDFPMSRYASIDREWNRVVELRLFKDITVFPLEWPIRWTSEVEIQRELVDFGIICGKRSGRVSRVLLRLHDFCHASSENHPHLQILFQVFDLMKDWSLEDREQQGLIELGLDFLRVDVSSSWMDEHILQLGRFPQVPIISSIRELRPEWCSVHLHPCILAALCQKLPSIHHASLTHQSGQSEHISTGDFIRSMDSLRIHRPGLTHLDLRTGLTKLWIREFIPTPLPVIQRLSDSPSPWSDRLVSLKMYYSVVVEDFLRSASKVVWPNLKTIKLVGAIDVEREDGWNYVNADDENAVADETSSRVIGALITALPSMPKATKFQIRMTFNPDFTHKAFKVSIHLDNNAKTEKTGRLQQPCVASFVPDSNSGVATMRGIYLPGSTTIKLQDVVRAQRRQELQLFACDGDGYYDRCQYYKAPHRPCAKWNRRTESWEAVFRNNLDIFIYEMGQYWETVDHMAKWDSRWW